MSFTIQEEVTLTTITCGECGVVFAMPERLRSECQETGKGFYCPNGHCRAYKDSEVKKLQRELQQERQKHDQSKAKLRDTEKSLIAQKGQTTKLKNRVKHGVCPCCHRTFKQLAAHMKNKHPQFADDMS